MTNIKRLIPAVVMLALTVPLAGTRAASAASTQVSPLMCSPTRVDLARIHDYGAVPENPRVDLVFWGSWWQSQDSQATTAISELKNLFSGLGGSAWANTLTQYCGALVGTNFPYQPACWGGSCLYSVVIDPSNPPTEPSDQDFTNEAAKEVPYSDYGGTIPIIITPPGVTSATDLANGSCAHHNWGPEPGVDPNFGYGISLPYAWAEIPYQLISESQCQAVNAHGKGIGTDGALSLVAGHEWAETVTDPYPGLNLATVNLGSALSHANVTATGWTAQTPSGSIEIGDLCEPFAVDGIPQGDVAGQPRLPFQLTLSTGTFWMQTLWSNEAGPANQEGRCVKGSTG